VERALTSIVVTTRNRERFLAEAVASVCNQTCRDWELIVVDDASDDGTWAWLQSVQCERIRVFRQPILGRIPQTRNMGLRYARGEFVMFLDDDDRLRRGALSKLLAPLLEDDRPVAAVGAVWRFVEWGDGIRIHHTARPATRIAWPDLLFAWSAVSGQNLYRTEIVRSVGGVPDIPLVEDRAMWLQIARRGPVAFVPDIVLEYRAHGEQSPKPPNIQDVREQLFEDFIRSLPAAEQPSGRRIRASARWAAEADAAFAGKKYAQAFRRYIRALCAAPSLARSPLVGPPLWWGAKKSIYRIAGIQGG